MFTYYSRYKSTFPLADFILICAVAFLVGCGSPYSSSIDRGDSYMLNDGHPEFALTAQPLLITNTQINLSVWVNLVQGSLIYSNSDSVQSTNIKLGENALVAPFTLSAQLFSTQKMEKLLASAQGNNALTAESQSITEDQTAQQFHLSINSVPSGNFWLRVVITDHNSGKSTTRKIPITIKDPSIISSRPLLTSIIMSGANEEREYQPVVTYTTPARFDSLLFKTQIWSNSYDNVKLKIKLIRFKSDQKPARDLSGRNYSSSSIRYQGIDFDNTTTILSDTLSVNLSNDVSTEISYSLKRPNIGTYRLSVSVIENDKLVDTETRAFGVKSPWFPALRSMRELASPLIYLMNEKDYDKMMAINDPQELKNAYDRFWLENIGDPLTARDVVQKYNERVLEANKQFTNYKAGWKTDLGMIYILFGPPWYVENRGGKMKWSFAYDRDDPRYNFIFDRYRYKNKFYPFYNYRMIRDRFYFDIGYRQRELWLNGTILQRDI
jgi:GWxTD domain-containing protein